MAHVDLPQRKQQIKFVVEEKGQDGSEMPFLALFHIHQQRIYRQVCGTESASADVRGPQKPVELGTVIHTWSLGLRAEDEGIGLGNFKGSLQLSDFMI